MVATVSAQPLCRSSFWSAGLADFDVAVIGGGVQGACVFHQLSASRLNGRPLRVLLIDKGDFASGTSQASAMLVWGGLLYLKQFALLDAWRYSAARDTMLKELADHLSPHDLSFVFGRSPFRSPRMIAAALWLYWLIGRCRRQEPGRLRTLPDLLSRDAAAELLRFEEGRLRGSDAQFVQQLIYAGRQLGGCAMNYCEVAGGHYEPSEHCWRITLSNTLRPAQLQVRCQWLINAAGPWADTLASRFAIECPWRHFLAKGASITFRPPAPHEQTLVPDARPPYEGMSLVPFGPVSLWGSTESAVASPDEGWEVDAGDLHFLLESLNRHLARPVELGDVIGLRCGLRPLVIRQGQAPGDPMMMCKRWQIWRDPHRPWIGVYGGKLTACRMIAERTAGMIPGVVPPAGSSRHRGSRASRDTCLGRLAPSVFCAGDAPSLPLPLLQPPACSSFAGIPVPSATWCRDELLCCTLEDYLRRRTNLAQWVARSGLGAAGEHRSKVLEVARQLAPDGAAAEHMLAEYEQLIARRHDALLGRPALAGAATW